MPDTTNPTAAQAALEAAGLAPTTPEADPALVAGLQAAVAGVEQGVAEILAPPAPATSEVPEAAFPSSIVVTPEMLATHAETVAQVEKWGEQRHPDGTAQHNDDIIAVMARNACDEAARAGTVTWRHILEEEVREAYAESDLEKLYVELTQIAAVCHSWQRDLRTRGAGRRAAEAVTA